MPAQSAISTTADFLDAYAAAIRGEEGPRADVRRGSTLDLAGGSAAMLWGREAQRDRDLFRGVYAETAAGDDLARIGGLRYGVTPETAARGQGQALLQRPAGGTAGTIYAGTRINLQKAAAEPPVPYRVTQDVAVFAVDLIVPVPIKAARTGAGTAANVDGSVLQFDDSVFDRTFALISLQCADGTDDEAPAAFLSRARALKRAGRVGYRQPVINACKAAGAAQVVVLDAGAFDPDSAITNVYVGDANYTTSAALLDACALALEAVRVEGCDTQVLGMTVTPVTLTAACTLWANPSTFDLVALKRDVLGALLQAFSARPEFWLFDLNSLGGEVATAASGAVQSVAIATSPAPPSPGFMIALPRYTLASTDVTLTFTGP